MQAPTPASAGMMMMMMLHWAGRPPVVEYRWRRSCRASHLPTGLLHPLPTPPRPPTHIHPHPSLPAQPSRCCWPPPACGAACTWRAAASPACGAASPRPAAPASERLLAHACPVPLPLCACCPLLLPWRAPLRNPHPAPSERRQRHAKQAPDRRRFTALLPPPPPPPPPPLQAGRGPRRAPSRASRGCAHARPAVLHGSHRHRVGGGAGGSQRRRAGGQGRRRRRRRRRRGAGPAPLVGAHLAARATAAAAAAAGRRAAGSGSWTTSLWGRTGACCQRAGETRGQQPGELAG